MLISCFYTVMGYTFGGRLGPRVGSCSKYLFKINFSPSISTDMFEDFISRVRTTLVLHTNALCNLHGTVYVSGLLSGERTEVTVHKDRYFLRPVISLIKSPCRFRSGDRHICLLDQVMRYIVGLLFCLVS